MTRLRLLLLVALLGVAAVPAVALVRIGDGRSPAAPWVPSVPSAAPSTQGWSGSRAAPARTSETAALRVLHAWDARRADAWAAGSPARLRALYVPGSAAGEADVRLLRDYLARGLRVTGMRTQVLALRVLDGRPDRWRVEVSDRLAGAVVVGAGRRTTLPRDSASTRVVTLVRGPGHRWRVAAVTARR